MKKIILLTLITFMTVGCIKPITIEDLDIVNIDSCEYINCHTYGINSCVYSHKGHCRFCKERRKQELKELVEQLK